MYIWLSISGFCCCLFGSCIFLGWNKMNEKKGDRRWKLLISKPPPTLVWLDSLSNFSFWFGYHHYVNEMNAVGLEMKKYPEIDTPNIILWQDSFLNKKTRSMVYLRLIDLIGRLILSVHPSIRFSISISTNQGYFNIHHTHTHFSYFFPLLLLLLL